MAFAEIEIPRRPAMAFFAVFAIAMVVGAYLFVLLLAAACVLVPYFILTSSESFSAQILVLFLFGIVIAATMVWSLIPRRDKFTAPGMLLARSAHLKLFAELDSIAAALGEEVPGEVYLIGAANAFVADRGGVMGFGSRRVMGLGIPLLAMLTVSEFRAVLAHEFAHYYGGDTSLGPWVYKTKSSMVRIFENIGSVGELARIAILGLMYVVVTTLLKWFFMAFLRGINMVSRKQEYRADELACLIAGRRNLVSGLRAIHRAATAWPAYWTNEVAPALDGGSLVAVGEGFCRFVSVPEISAAISKDLETRLREEKTEPYDTHPPLRDRMAAAEKLSDSALSQDSRAASSLLENLPAAEMQFVEDQIPDLRPGTLEYVGWDEVGVRVTIPGWRKFVGEYAEPLQGVNAESIPDHVSEFRQIGSRIRDPKGMLLSPQQRTVRAAGLFAAALALRMTEAGWEIQVQPAIFRIFKQDREFNPFLAVQALLAGKMSADQWRTQCRELGLSEIVLLAKEGDPAAKQQPESAQHQLFAVGSRNDPVNLP